MLLPTLAKAKTKANRLKCSNKLKSQEQNRKYKAKKRKKNNKQP
jgi:hypothetical protein